MEKDSNNDCFGNQAPYDVLTSGGRESSRDDVDNGLISVLWFELQVMVAL